MGERERKGEGWRVERIGGIGWGESERASEGVEGREGWRERERVER